MATSGTIRPSSNGIYVRWNLSSQSVSGNYSVVSITFGWGFHSSPLDRQLDDANLKVNGTTVYNKTGRVKNYTGDFRDRDHPVWSGTRTIYHNAQGNATLSIEAAMTGWQGYRSTGKGSWSLPQIPRLPGAPGTPSVSGHADSDPTTASFSWSAPSSVGAGLSQRQIQVSRDSGFTDLVVDHVAGWGTTYSATGLPKGTTLYARVRASSAAGWGPWSGVRTFTTGTTVPSAPGAPAASAITGKSMSVTWTPPVDSGGATISQYHVQRATNAAFNQGLVSATLPGTSASLQVTGLAHTTTYYYRVRATNAAGHTGPWSESRAATTTATTPTPPEGLEPEVRTATSLTLTWDPPADDGGAVVTGYEVQLSRSHAFSSPMSVATSDASVSVSSLEPSTNYYVRTRAVNDVGASDWSAPLLARTTSGLWVSDGTAWREADVWVAASAPGGYVWRRCFPRVR